MIKKLSLLISTILIASIFITGCTTNKNNETTGNNESATVEEKSELEKITVTLDWTPNTNHTGLYVAKDKGYYEEAGLEVEIVQPSSGTAEQLVAANTAQFGISYQEAVTFARLEGVPVVSIAAIIQHNTSGFASIKEKGIETPADFEGKRYGGWGSPVEEATLKVLMEKYNADVDKVEILTSGATDFFASSENDIDFAWIFEGWTGVEAELKGIELNYVDLGKEETALDYYTPVIITNEDNLNNNSELVKKFMEATAKGYEAAIENPSEAADILVANAPELDKELVLKSQEFLSAKYQDDAAQWGVQKQEVWDNYTNWLFDNELISEKIDTNAAFTNDFLPVK
jgi:ABC-type nitrate/sulfonate/bicarbonate transport system substrate-binding protein